MKLIDNILHGKARIGRPGYILSGKIFSTTVRHNDNKRLKKQSDDTSDLSIQKDIPYIQDRNRFHLLDIIRKKDASTKEPLLVVIHGGGLLYGDKELNKYSNYELARRGYTVVALSYPLLPKVNFHQQLKDCFSALCFLNDHKNELSLDLSGVFLWGDSAGGMICYSLACINRNPELRKLFDFPLVPAFHILGLGLVSPMSHLDRHDELAVPGKVAFLKKDRKLECFPYLLDTRKLISKEDMPPVYLSTSDKDMIRKDVLSLAEICKSFGIRYRLDDFSSKEHPLEHVFPICYPKYQESKEVFDHASSFFSLLG